MATVADLEIVVNANTGNTKGELSGVNSELETMSRNGAMAGAGMVGFGSLIFAGFGKAIMGAADFEAAIVDAQIATNMSTKDIEAMVYSLAEAYPVATIEVANLIEELGKMGHSGEGLEELTESVIQLSTALGTDLIPTGELLDTLLITVGGSADEIADKLFRVLNAGRLGADSFAAAWKYVGSVFKGSGLAFEEMAALIDILVQNGLNAETAGRVLENLFKSLVNPSEALKTKLTELGITFTDLEGNLLGAKEIFYNIIDAWKDLSDIEQLDLAALLVGEDFATNLDGLMDRGRAAIEDFIEKFNSAMNLQDAMKAKMGTAKAMWDTFMETIDNVSIVVGQQLLPAFKSFLGFVTPIVSGIKDVDGSIIRLAVGITGLVAGIVGLAGIFGLAAAGSGILAAGFGLLVAPIFLAVGAIAAIAAGLVYAYTHFETFRTVVDAVAGAIAGVASWAWQFEGVRIAVMSLGAAAGALLVGMLALRAVAGLQKIFAGLRLAVMALNTAFLANPFVLIAAAVIALGVAMVLLYKRWKPFRKLVDGAASAVADFAGVVSDYAIRALNYLGPLVEDLADAIGNDLVSGFNSFMGIARSAGNFIMNLVNGFMNFVRTSALVQAGIALVSGVIGAHIGLLSSLWDAVMIVVDAFGEGGLVGALKALPQAFGAVLDAMVQFAGDVLNAFLDVDWAGAAAEVVGYIVSGIGAGAGAAGNLWGWLTESLSNAISSMSAAVNTGISLAWDAITSLNWGDWIDPLAWADWLGEKIGNFGDWLWTKIQEFFPSSSVITGTIGNIADWVWQKIQRFFPAAPIIVGVIGSIATWVWGKIGRFFPSARLITDSIGAFTTWVWGKINTYFPKAALITDVIGSFKTWVWEKIRQFFPVVSVLTDAIGSFKTWVWEKIRPFFPSASVLTDAIGSFKTWIWGKINSFFPNAQLVVDAIGSFKTWVWSKISAFFPSASVLVDAIGSFRGWIWGKISTFFPSLSLITDSIGAFTTWIWGKIHTYFPSALLITDSIGAFTTWIWGKISTFFPSLSLITNPIGNFGMWVWGKISSYFPAVYLITDAIGNFKTWIWGKISTYFPNALLITDSIGAFTSWIWNKISTFFPSLALITDAIGNFKDWVWGKISSFFPSSALVTGGIGDFGDWLWGKIKPLLPGFLGGGGESTVVGPRTTYAGATITDPQPMGGDFGFGNNQQFGGNTARPPRGGGPGINSLGRDMVAPTVDFSAFTAALSTADTTIATWVTNTTNSLNTTRAAFTTFSANVGTTMNTWGASLRTAVTTAMTSLRTQITTGTTGARTTFTTFTTGVQTSMTTLRSNITTAVTTAMTSMRTQVTSGTTSARTSFTTFASTTRATLTTWGSGIRSTVTSAMSGVRSAIQSGMSAATGVIRSGVSQWSSAVSSGAGAMRSAGVAVGSAAGQGVAAGMNSALGAVRAAANAIIAEVDRAMRAKAQIASPSKMTTYFGQMIGEGLVVGLRSMMWDVSRAGTNLSNAALVAPGPSFGTAQGGTGRVLSGNTTVVYVTNTYTVNVEDLEELNQAVDFVSNLDRERQLFAF